MRQMFIIYVYQNVWRKVMRLCRDYGLTLSTTKKLYFRF